MNHPYQHLISGGLSGFSSTILLQPLDLIRTRLQQENKRVLNIPQVAQKIWQEKGVRGLWRGTNASLARNVPGVAIYFSGLQHVRYTLASLFPWAVASRKTMTSRNGKVSTLPSLSAGGNLAAGAVTRVGVGLILNPLTIVKARYESNYYSYKSISQAVVSITRGGPRVLFQGFTATAFRDGPYAGIFLVVYEGFKETFGNVIVPTSLWGPTITHTLSGAAGGTVATLLTSPFDVIKTKMQVRKEDKYRTIGKTVKSILEDRGLRGLFDGASLRLSRKVLSSMISWTIYEGTLLVFRNYSVETV